MPQRAIIGAPDSLCCPKDFGAAYIFAQTGDGWLQEAKVTGSAVSGLMDSVPLLIFTGRE
jgi:hypothetical protein